MAPARGGPTVLGRGSVGIAPDGRRRGAALGLLSVAIFVGEEPVGAQEAESTGVGIRLSDLSDYPTHLTVDRFLVELTNLTATETYQVVVSSDSARVGIGGCGTSSRTATVTGVAERELSFAIYACAVGEATVTAEVRRTGASSAEASVSQRLTVEAVPEIVIGPSGERIRTTTTTRGTRQAVPKAGTPGIVPMIEFHDITSSSVHVTWHKPSDGGPDLTGYGLLFWPGTEADQPGYETAEERGTWPRNSDYTGLQSGRTYNFRIHACNGSDSCGYWTNPPETVDIPTPQDPDPVTNLRSRSGNGTLTLTWEAPGESGSGKLTGYHVQNRQSGGSWPIGVAVVTPATTTTHTIRNLVNGRRYDVRVQACNGDSLCGAWVKLEDVVPGDTVVEPIVESPPGPVRDLAITGVEDGTLKVDWEPPSGPNNTVTGYKLQRKLHANSAWPSTVTPVTASKLDISRLTNGTKYDVRVQACNANANNPCGAWVSPVCGVPGLTTKPGQVGIPNLTSSHETLTVSWDAPACVSAITHYEVQATTAPSDETVDPTWPSAGEDVSGAPETDLAGS